MPAERTSPRASSVVVSILLRVRAIPIALAATAAALALAPVAAAHGDPASEELGTDDVFLSLDPPASTPTGRQLEALATAARRHTFALKIAVVPRRKDLGAQLQYFRHPDAYARYLQRELGTSGTGAARSSS